MNTYISIRSIANIRWFFLIIFSGVLLTSCQEPLDTDYVGLNETLLMVDGKITTDTTSHCVKLSRTVALNQKEMQWETDAQVQIINNSQVYPLTEDQDAPGHYYTALDVYGVIGESYELQIELENGATYSATTVINDIPEIDSIKFEWAEIGYGYYLHQCFYHGWEPEHEGDYYLWNLTINDTLYNDTVWKSTFVSDEFVNGQYIGVNKNTGESDFAIYALEYDELETDTNFVSVSMETIPKEYFDFLNSLLTQTVFVGSPFDANKADLLDNISGDAIGFFYGASVKHYDFVYIRPEESIDWEPPF